MAKKSAIKGEYIIQIEDTGSVVAYKIYDNVKGALREVSEIKSFEYDNNWTTRQLGSKIIKAFGENKQAIINEYYISENTNGSIEVYKIYDNVKGALREISESIGFEYDNSWTTRQFGSKLVDYINKDK